MSKKKDKSPIEVIRDVKTINADYNTVCAKAGEAQFKMKALEGELNGHNQRLVEIIREHNAASAELARKQAEATPEPQAVATGT